MQEILAAAREAECGDFFGAVGELAVPRPPPELAPPAPEPFVIPPPPWSENYRPETDPGDERASPPESEHKQP